MVVCRRGKENQSNLSRLDGDNGIEIKVSRGPILLCCHPSNNVFVFVVCKHGSLGLAFALEIVLTSDNMRIAYW